MATIDADINRRIECRTCHQHLPVAQFYKAHIGPNSRRSLCRKCSILATRVWERANPERAKANLKRSRANTAASAGKWQKENRERVTEYMRGYRERNRERIRQINADSRRRNPEVVAAAKVERRSRMRTHVPPWADRKAIKAIYLECRRLRKETGLDYQVDHIIPLKGKNVCGLHVETNLQILLGIENMRKANRMMEPY